MIPILQSLWSNNINVPKWNFHQHRLKRFSPNSPKYEPFTTNWVLCYRVWCAECSYNRWLNQLSPELNLKSTHWNINWRSYKQMDLQRMVWISENVILNFHYKNILKRLKRNIFHSGVFYRIFLKYVQYEQYDDAIEIKKQCDRAGVLETPAKLSSLLKLWTATKDELNALKVLRNLQGKHPNYRVDTNKLVDLATLLVSKDRMHCVMMHWNSLMIWANVKCTF